MTTNQNVVMNHASELLFGFEERPEYIRQYYALVDQFYKKDLNVDLTENHMPLGLLSEASDELIYLVRDGERVIGGAKLSFSSRHATQGLPMEEGEFKVARFLPEDFGDREYAEIGRLVIDPEYRGKDILQRMVLDTARFARKEGCGYLFVLAPALNAVLYRRICRSLGMPIEQHRDANLPDKALYRQLDIKLLSSDIRQYFADSMPVEAQYDIAV